MLSAPLQFIYCGKKSNLTIGNVKPVGELPEGTIICNVEEVSKSFWLSGGVADDHSRLALCGSLWLCI